MPETVRSQSWKVSWAFMTVWRELRPRASAYDLANVTDTPVILIVNSRGMSVSLAAYVKGFLEYKKDSHIKGVIFNQMSPMLYPRMKKLLEEELGVAGSWLCTEG